jgi:hypothetical protein
MSSSGTPAAVRLVHQEVGRLGARLQRLRNAAIIQAEGDHFGAVLLSSSGRMRANFSRSAVMELMNGWPLMHGQRGFQRAGVRASRWRRGDR